MSKFLRILVRALAALMFVVVGRFALSIFYEAKAAADVDRCMSNQEDLARAMLLYAESYDGRLPSRDDWYTQVQRQSLLKYPTSQCPELKHQGSHAIGYAMNGALNRADTFKQAHPETTPLTYDSINPAPNASDIVTSLPHPARHIHNNMSYLDGHVRSVR